MARKNYDRASVTVALIDGHRLTRVEFKSGAAVSLSEQDYDTELEAIKAASPKYAMSRKTVLVWCGLVTARISRTVQPSEHPEAAQLADARYLAKVFGKDSFVAMSGSVALSPEAQPEILEYLAATRPRMVFSGMCVAPDQDGIWLRVGRRNVEATLVSKGEIRGWTALCEGLDSVAKMIQQGTPAAAARSRLSEQVVSEVRMAIMQWQRTRTVPPQIWLHGPGGDPSSEIHQALLLHSGCRVAPPNMPVPASVELSQFVSLLPTSKYALTSPRADQPQFVLKKSAKDRRRKIVAAATMLLLAISGMSIYSALLGSLKQQQLADKERELEELTKELQELENSFGDRNITDLEEMRETLNLIKGEKSPDWGMIFRLAERFAKPEQPLTVSSDRSKTSVSTVICCKGTDDYSPLLTELDNWARIIYGKEASASVGTSIQEGPNREISVSALLSIPDNSG